jgi:hypothetical protein
VTYRAFLAEVRKRAGDNLTCEILLRDFEDGVSAQPTNPPDWREKEVDPEQVGEMLAAIQYCFMMTGARLASIADDPVYKEASQVAGHCTAVLNEEFRTNFSAPEVLSPSRLMERMGLVEIRPGADGENYVVPK